MVSTSSYNASKAHNMLAFMLDPHFKSLDVVKVFFEQANVLQVVAKYDIKTLMPLLVVAFYFLTPPLTA
jgi:hypothetical protein